MPRLLLSKLFLIVVCFPAWALPVEPPLPDAAQEARAKTLFHELRCVVCDSESVADSPAEIAKDVRIAVRQAIADGKTDEEIRDYMVSRYGEYVLMKPPLRMGTVLLWLGPGLILLFGMGVLIAYFRKAYSNRAGSAG